MKAGKSKSSNNELLSLRPAMSPEARESQMIALAMENAEKQLREGTASPSVIVHFLKLGSQKEQIEKEKLQKEKDLLEAKVEALESTKRIEELYEKAISSMREYSGSESNEEDI